MNKSMTQTKKTSFQRILGAAAAFLAALVFAGTFPLNTVNAAEPTAVYTLDYDRYTMNEIDELTPGVDVEVQIHVKYAVKSVALFLTNPDGTEETRAQLDVKVYDWDTNILKSLAGAAIREGSCEGPVTEGEAVFDFGGEPLEAGQYVVRFEMTGGGRALIERRKPAPLGVRFYYKEKCGYGSPVGSVVFTEEVLSPFRLASSNVDLVYHEAPPEPTLDPEGAIVKLDVDSTKWGAVDGLGRTLPSYKQAGGKKQKLVGIFYWTWHWGQGSGNGAPPRNINNILTEYPEAVNDYNHEVWQQPSGGNFWNEPIWGYYTEEDDYVLRKHAELLADAGIDFVMFDCTNADAVWTEAYLNLLKVWSKAREDGVNTPKIGFMMQFGYSGNTRSSLWQVYTTIYRDNRYQDLWFYLDGKPLVMAWDTGLDPNQGDELELKEFFTFRHPCASYWEPEHDDTCWGWLSAYPQALYKNEDGTVEFTTVGIAQNANYETQSLSAMNSGANMGRSYAGQKNYSYSYKYRGKRIKVDSKIENSKFYGRNFQEQWDYAISVDPEIVFVTGWNEWIMGRYEEWCGVSNAFPDQCDDENSRDIEPTKGDLKDYYYYQLVANVRRFKGMSEPDYQPEAVSMTLEGDITSGWNDPQIITYNHYAHNTLARDYKGFGKTHYTGDAIRNDIVKAKVAYDDSNVWFYVETLDELTPCTDPCWMRLLIDSGAATASSKDWEEFEYIVGREGTTAETMRLEKSTGGWNWEKVADVKYKVSGKVLVLEIPRKLLGKAGKSLNFGFKWCDNNIADGDIMTLYTDGDAAPGGRFTFVFAAKPAPKVWPYVIAGACVVAAAVAAVIAVAAVKMRKGKDAGKNAPEATTESLKTT